MKRICFWFGLILFFAAGLMLAVPALPQNPQTQTAPLYAVNAKYTNGLAPGYMPCGNGAANCLSTTGLNINIGPGTVNCAGTITSYAGGNFLLTGNTTNYVYLNTAASCAPAVKTSAFTATDIPIAIVVATSSSLTITDVRGPFASNPALSGSANDATARATAAAALPANGATSTGSGSANTVNFPGTVSAGTASIGTTMALGAPGSTPISGCTTPVADTNDSATAILNAYAAAKAKGQWFVLSGCFNINQKLVFSGGADMHNATFFTWNTPTVAVEVSSGTCGGTTCADPKDSISNAQVAMPEVINMTKPSGGWLGQGIGTRVVNCHSCLIIYRHVLGFAVGYDVTAFGNVGQTDAGTVYSTFVMGFGENNQTCIKLHTGDGVGWVNENVFLGEGRCQINSNEGIRVPGTSLIDIDNALPAPNGNHFYSPSLEGSAPQWNAIIGGTNNQIIAGRWEVTSPYYPQVLYNAQNGQGGGNTIFYGNNADAIQFTYCAPAWQPNTAYAVNAIASYGNNIFLATVAGTSGSTIPTAWTSPTPTQGVTTFTDGGTLTWKNMNINVTQCPATPDTSTSAFTNHIFTGKTSLFGLTNSIGWAFQQNNPANPIFTFYYGGSSPLGNQVALNPGSWAMQFGAQTQSGKLPTDAYARITTNFATGQIFFGDGTAAPSAYLLGGSNGGATQLLFNRSLVPTASSAYDLGSSSFLMRNGYLSAFLYVGGVGSGGIAFGNSGPTITTNSNIPSGSCTSGSLRTNTTGGNNTATYECVAGAWQALASVASLPSVTETWWTSPISGTASQALSPTSPNAIVGQGFVAPAAGVTFSKIYVTGQTADGTGLYSVAIADSNGNLVCHPTTGQHITTTPPVNTFACSEGTVTLTGGAIYIFLTTGNATTALLYASSSQWVLPFQSTAVSGCTSSSGVISGTCTITLSATHASAQVPGFSLGSL